MIEDPIDILDDMCPEMMGNQKFCIGTPGSTFKYTFHHSKKDTIPTSLTLSIGNINQTKLMAHYVWKSSIFLARLIDFGYIDVRDLSVVELGAGIGLPSFVAACNLSSKVVVTDYPDDVIIDNLKRNKTSVMVDMKSLRGVSPIFVRGYKWGNFFDNGEMFDIILLADTFWLDESHDDLLDSLQMLLNPNGAVYMTCCNHAFSDVASKRLSVSNSPAEPVDVKSIEDLKNDLDLTGSSRSFLEKAIDRHFHVTNMKTRLIEQSIEESFNVAFYRINRR